MRFSILSFALVASALALARPQIRRGLSLNPALPDTPPDWTAIDAASNAGAVTNGQRLARGLPLLKPKSLRRYSQRNAPHRLGSRVQSAPRSETSSLPPVNQKCNILVKSSSQTYGFISPAFNDFGEYGLFQTSQDGALEVSLPYSVSSSGQNDFLATNGPTATYPYMGAVVGFASTSDDFAAGSYNYAVIAGVGQTSPGSTPVEGSNSYSTAADSTGDYESAIWTYDPVSQAMTPQWINSDGGAPATHIVYANDDNKTLLITGDVATLQAAFESPYPEVTFTCVPPAASS